MKIFISWSGEISKNIAEILRHWIPNVIQTIKPYYSPEDIIKGTRWSSEIATELEESKIGLICLTKDNLQSPWIMFEAGALSKNIDSSKVCPILFNLEPTDIVGPLIQFQSTRFSKEEMKKILKMMNNELGDSSLDNIVFEKAFDKWWPDLEEKIQIELSKQINTNGIEVRKEREILEEILNLTRGISITRERATNREINIHPKAIKDLVYSWINVVSTLHQNENSEIISYLESAHKPLIYLVERVDFSSTTKDELISSINESLFVLNRLLISNIQSYKINNKSDNPEV